MQSLFSFVVLLLTAVNCVTAQKTSPRQCAKGVHIISGHAHQGGPLGPDFPVDVPSIPGTPFEKRQDPNVAGFGTLYPLFSAIRTAIPGTTNYTTPFPSYIAARVSQEIYQGTQNMTKAITSYADSCPNTPIVLAGFSAGGVLILNSLCGSSSAGFIPTPPLPQKYRKNILAAVAYGDETRAPDVPFNRGTCETAGPLVRLDSPACSAIYGKIRSWCDAADPACCLGGTNQERHYQYGQENSKAAADFVISKWRKHVANRG